MRCFYCQHLSLGEISTKHYYCMECCLEFKVVEDRWYGYMIDEEGDLHLEVSSDMTFSPAGTTHQTID